jgi:isoquinoline 1-oxidoreductase beta subunit
MKTNRNNLQITRRDFLKLTGTTGAGLVLAVFLDACAPASATPEIALVTPTDTMPTHRPPFDWTPNIYLNLDNNGNLTVTAFRSEMGQGIRTALAMLVADELDVDWNSVRIVQAPADSKYGDQITGGSRSIRSYYDGMRKAGAVARQMLVEAAAQAWGVEADACQTEAGYVIHPDSNQKIAYADLVESAADLKVPRDVQIKDKSQLNIIGTGLGHWDAPDIVTGKAIYGFDVRLPDMLFAVIARCPVIDGKFDSYDEAGALAVPGVRQIVELPKSIAVVAENSWAAIQGRNALNVSWEEGRNANLNTDEMRLEAAKSLPEPGSAGENSIDALYEMPYQAHATMETMNCTVHVHDGICEVWAPTQNPQLVQSMVTAATRTQQDKVTVHVPLIGGGFGRRLEADYAFEAGQVAQALQTPVQVFWTREDDFQHDYYHEMSVHYANGSLSEVRMPAIGTVGGSGVPTGAWRSVHNFTEAYPTQCFIDELAIATQRDSLDLRLELYDNRAAAVIKLAAEKAGWGNSLPAGWGRGVAYHSTFATHVAHVVEVSVDDNGNVLVQRVVCAVDCGAVVNPDNIAAQMEGGIVFGLTAALKAGVTIENGRVQQSNFHDYPLLQMSEMPVVQVHIIESDNPPTGIGEMGVPPIAPAVANAVFAATGIRVRHIPIRPEDLKL